MSEAQDTPGPQGSDAQHSAEPHPLYGRRGKMEPERELWADRYSPKAMYATWLYTLVLTIVVVVLGWYFRAQAGDYWSWIAYALIGLWLIQAVRMLYYRFHDRYVLTNHKLLHKSGLVIQKTDRIEVIDIDDTTYSQSLFERLFGVGTIKVHSSDKTHPEFEMPGIENVEEVTRMIDEAQRKERHARAAYVESV